MQALMTDMLRKAVPTLMTIWAPVFSDQRLGGLDVHGVERMALKHAILFHRVLVVHGGDDGVAFRAWCARRCGYRLAHRCSGAFVRDHLGDAAGADDEYVLFHVGTNSFCPIVRRRPEGVQERLCS
jgi:hypothetical protein